MNKSSIHTVINERLAKQPLFYVCRDLERSSSALKNKWNNYYIITNNSKFSEKLSKIYNNIYIVNSDKILDTYELLDHPETKKIIKKNNFILVFKNTLLTERICEKNKWKLLNPSAELASKAEEKIKQIKWLGTLRKYLPPHKIDICSNIKWNNKKFILQFNRSHTGTGTILIKNKKQLEEIKNKFPKREVRITKFIKGPTFTNNNIAWGNKIFIGNISYQITGLKPFTSLGFATVGNDWSVIDKILPKEQISEYKKICRDIGKKLIKQGWKGLFGVDIIADEKTKKLYLIEINARQPASTTFESQLQSIARSSWVKKKDNINNNVTSFEAHMASVLGIKPNGFKLKMFKNGAQIIKRTKKGENKISKKTIDELTKLGFDTVEYDNYKPETDKLRIYSMIGIMSGHNKLNKIGQKIKNLI